VPNLDVLPNAGLNVYDILRCETLVLTPDAIGAIHARFAKDAAPAPKKRAPAKTKADTQEGAAA
jgi:large subunit ribosomal protein L4